MHHWGSLKLIELNCFLYVFDVIFVFHINIDAVRPLCHCQFQDILFFHKAIFLLYSYMFQTKKKTNPTQILVSITFSVCWSVVLS